MAYSIMIGFSSPVARSFHLTISPYFVKAPVPLGGSSRGHVHVTLRIAHACAPSSLSNLPSFCQASSLLLGKSYIGHRPHRGNFVVVIISNPIWKVLLLSPYSEGSIRSIRISTDESHRMHASTCQISPSRQAHHLGGSSMSRRARSPFTLALSVGLPSWHHYVKDGTYCLQYTTARLLWPSSTHRDHIISVIYYSVLFPTRVTLIVHHLLSSSRGWISPSLFLQYIVWWRWPWPPLVLFVFSFLGSRLISSACTTSFFFTLSYHFRTCASSSIVGLINRLNIVSALCVKAKDQLIHNTYLVRNSDSKEWEYHSLSYSIL